MDNSSILTPDILIIGGGIVGSLLSVALQGSRYRVLLCDASDFLSKSDADFDARSIALNQASIQILSQLGVWEALKAYATPIQTIQVSSQAQFGTTQLKQTKDSPLGVVVEIHRFYAVLRPLLPPERTHLNTRLTHYDPETKVATLLHQEKTLTVKPKLIVAADGTASSLRPFLNLSAATKDFHQLAIVANIALKRHHQYLAIERFTPEGPVALLPLEKNKMSLVWCVSPKRAQSLIDASDARFLQELQDTVGYRLGRLTQVGKRLCHPLKQFFMPQVISDSVVFVGNAAQTLHPVAGQGLNLGLRDIATLAQCLLKADLSPETLKVYQSLRQEDRQALTKATEQLVTLFTHSSRSVRLLRSLALTAFDQSKRIQSSFIHHASGFGHRPPDLACGIPLKEDTHGI